MKEYKSFELLQGSIHICEQAFYCLILVVVFLLFALLADGISSTTFAARELSATHSVPEALPPPAKSGNRTM